MSLRMTWLSKAPGEGLQAMNFTHCLHTLLAIEKYTDICQGGGSGGGRGVTLEDLSVEEFVMKESNFPWRWGAGITVII